MKNQMKPFILALALACFTSTGYAAKLFAVEFTYSGGTVLVEDSSLPDLVNDLIKIKGPFQGLAERPYSAEVCATLAYRMP